MVYIEIRISNQGENVCQMAERASHQRRVSDAYHHCHGDNVRPPDQDIQISADVPITSPRSKISRCGGSYRDEWISDLHRAISVDIRNLADLDYFSGRCYSDVTHTS
jgi:hypothetical protein